MVPAQLTIAVGFLFAVSVCPPSTAAKKSTSAARTRSLESSLDDELIPSYECAHRSRDWTLRCMVPVTNFQMSLDLCGTKQVFYPTWQNLIPANASFKTEA
ncbi:AAEL008766-PA [Aedes aegypti]|uniref:AAEL008766-PA n=1 Tax=Aedes aegypti TaxID=7159 RepID=Q16XT6_AEDAE|nr:AAEL008766-PA [Aedes aegypti]